MTDYRHELRRFPAIAQPTELKLKDPKEGGVYVALPQGKRVFAWFTYCKSKNICFIVDGHAIYPVHAAFPTRFAFGTILSGILSQRVFTADMLCCDAGSAPTPSAFDRTMKELECPVYLPTQVKFQRAVTSLVPFFEAPYKIQCVKCIHGSSVSVYEEKYATFQVTALPTSDMYELAADPPLLALVDSYSRSVRLNALFRNISENRDLDLGEESNDDTPTLGPPLRMECRWHYKHKQWVPQECSIECA
jgi:hypothetical protein